MSSVKLARQLATQNTQPMLPSTRCNCQWGVQKLEEALSQKQVVIDELERKLQKTTASLKQKTSELIRAQTRIAHLEVMAGCRPNPLKFGGYNSVSSTIHSGGSRNSTLKSIRSITPSGVVISDGASPENDDVFASSESAKRNRPQTAPLFRESPTSSSSSPNEKTLGSTKGGLNNTVSGGISTMFPPTGAATLSPLPSRSTPSAAAAAASNNDWGATPSRNNNKAFGGPASPGPTPGRSASPGPYSSLNSSEMTSTVNNNNNNNNNNSSSIDEMHSQKQLAFKAAAEDRARAEESASRALKEANEVWKNIYDSLVTVVVHEHGNNKKKKEERYLGAHMGQRKTMVSKAVRTLLIGSNDPVMNMFSSEDSSSASVDLVGAIDSTDPVIRRACIAEVAAILSSSGEVLRLLACLLDAAECLSLPDMLWKLTQGAQAMLKAGSCRMWMVDEVRNEIYALPHWIAGARDNPNGSIVRVPLEEGGGGFAGHVARTSQALNVSYPAVSHPSFSMEHDRIAGTNTFTVLCVPVFYAGSPLAVIELFNKKPPPGQEPRDAAFNWVDQEFVHVIGSQCAVLVRNCYQVAEWRKMAENTVELVTITQNFAATEEDIYRVLSVYLQNVRSLLEAEVATLFLLSRGDENTDPYLWAKFEPPVDVTAIASNKAQKQKVQAHVHTPTLVKIPIGQGLVGWAAQEGKMINIPDAWEDSRFNRGFDVKSGFRTRTVLCVPVLDVMGKVLGVVQLINKRTSLFSVGDEQFVSVYCKQAALGIAAYREKEKISATIEHSAAGTSAPTTKRRTASDPDISLSDKPTDVDSLLMRLDRVRNIMQAERLCVYLVDKEKNLITLMLPTVVPAPESEEEQQQNQLPPSPGPAENAGDGNEQQQQQAFPAPKKPFVFKRVGSDSFLAAISKEKSSFPTTVKGIVPAVVRTGKPVVARFAVEHLFYHPDIDSQFGWSTQAILSLPVHRSLDENGVGIGDVIAVVEAANKRSASSGFAGTDIVVMQAVVKLVRGFLIPQLY